MMYKNKKEYDQALKNLDKALHDGAQRAIKGVESQNTDNEPARSAKVRASSDSE